MAAVALSAVAVNAACVDWKVDATATENDYSVYLLASLANSYESADAIAAAAIGSASIAKSGRTYTTGDQTATSSAITATSMKDAYYVIVTSADATQYTSYKVDMSAMVYDPDNQESSPGQFNSVKAATIISSGTSANFAAVPEPTSGLLMLLGIAGLALRRRRA